MEREKMYDLWKTVLDLDRDVVGVKFLNAKEEYDSQDATDIEKDMVYCVFIKSAMTGKSVKLRGTNFACTGSGSTFGYYDLPDTYYTGEWLNPLGLHKNVEVSKEVTNDMIVFDKKTYGVVAKPLNKYIDEEPDVILIVTKPYNAMRLSQGYTYEFGLKKDYQMAGNQAVCYEATAVPMKNKDMNIDMLCAGTRHRSQWKDEELIIGISWDIAKKVLSGVIKTINTIEPDDKKEKIIEKNGSNLVNGEEITMGSAYFYPSRSKEYSG